MIILNNPRLIIRGLEYNVEFLQSYLNEFCYRFNRRFCDCFERLMYASVMYKNTFIYRIYLKNVA